MNGVLITDGSHFETLTLVYGQFAPFVAMIVPTILAIMGRRRTHLMLVPLYMINSLFIAVSMAMRVDQYILSDGGYTYCTLNKKDDGYLFGETLKECGEAVILRSNITVLAYLVTFIINSFVIVQGAKFVDSV